VGGGGHVGERAAVESHKLDLWPRGCGFLILRHYLAFAPSSLSANLTWQSNPSLLTCSSSFLLAFTSTRAECFAWNVKRPGSNSFGTYVVLCCKKLGVSGVLNKPLNRWRF